MSSNQPPDLSRLCIHTITTKPWAIEDAADRYALAGVKGITVWRDALDGRNIRHTGHLLREHGLDIVSLCRGGFFAHKDPDKRKAAIEDNRKAISEAAELGTSMLVLVCGADPAQSLEDSRNRSAKALKRFFPKRQRQA